MEYVNLLDALPQAGISAPDLPGEARYRPEGWENEYVYPTVFSLPPNYGERPTLFLHAGARVTYTVALTQPAVLRFGMALDPRALDWGGDGATFEVFVNGARIFLEHLAVDASPDGWQERRVDLAGYAGQTVRLTLATTSGPRGEDTGDWAGWGEPGIEAVEAAPYRQVVEGKPWLSEWHKSGVRAQDFVRAGEEARRAERYQEALDWYRWATQVEPRLGDPWYYIGVLYEDQHQWALALDAYAHVTASSRLRQVHRSSPYYRAGLIYHQKLDPRQPESAIAAYRAAIEEDHFRAEWEAAGCHYMLGEILRLQNADPNESIVEFRHAIRIDPTHAWSYVRLGQVHYDQSKDATVAEADILKGLELAPRDKWIHIVLGDVYRQEGLKDKAVASYERALEIAPGFEAAKQRLAAIKDEQ
jgi:tetratricopeptide (TPR) repeat protein